MSLHIAGSISAPPAVLGKFLDQTDAACFGAVSHDARNAKLHKYIPSALKITSFKPGSAIEKTEDDSFERFENEYFREKKIRDTRATRKYLGSLRGKVITKLKEVLIVNPKNFFRDYHVTHIVADAAKDAALVGCFVVHRIASPALAGYLNMDFNGFGYCIISGSLLAGGILTMDYYKLLDLKNRGLGYLGGLAAVPFSIVAKEILPQFPNPLMCLSNQIATAITSNVQEQAALTLIALTGLALGIGGTVNVILADKLHQYRR